MPPTAVVVDASVALKWFHADGEADVVEAHALLDAARLERATIMFLDLTPYEVGNALLRGGGASATQVAVVLGALVDIGDQVAVTTPDLVEAARIAEAHGLTLYDAAYVAVARAYGAPLATADRAILRARLGETPTAIVAALG